MIDSQPCYLCRNNLISQVKKEGVSIATRGFDYVSTLSQMNQFYVQFRNISFNSKILLISDQLIIISNILQFLVDKKDNIFVVILLKYDMSSSITYVCQ